MKYYYILTKFKCLSLININRFKFINLYGFSFRNQETSFGKKLFNHIYYLKFQKFQKYLKKY